MNRPNYVQRLRLRFSKVGPTRFIGHLDLARTLERALNRAELPVAYTQGFNKRPRLQFAAALPLGFTSECELADVWLKEPMAPEAFHERLAANSAPGLIIHNVAEVPLSADALQNITQHADYRITLLDPVDETALAARIDALLAADHVPRERRGKTYDLRPLVLSLSLLAGEPIDPAPVAVAGGIAGPALGPVLHMRLSLRHGASGRPDEVLAALDLDPKAARVHRTALALSDA